MQAFKNQTNEAPTLYLAKLGQDGHDRGAKVIASAFQDFGMVIVGDLFETPEEAAESALAAGAHIVGVSSLAAGHKTLPPELIAALKAREAEDVMVICGGIIPQQDYAFLYDAGVGAIFALEQLPRCSYSDAEQSNRTYAADAYRLSR